MTLRLILMRHAKSDWNTPAAGDQDRPLNKRGRTAASAIGRWLSAQGHLPDLVLCSAARRTRETCALVLEAMGSDAETRFLDTLYLASAESMFQTLAGGGEAPCLMLIGHNPGTATLAAALARTPPAHPRFGDHPTGATTVLDFEVAAWDRIAARSGRLAGFVIPRELPDER